MPFSFQQLLALLLTFFASAQGTGSKQRDFVQEFQTIFNKCNGDEATQYWEKFLPFSCSDPECNQDMMEIVKGKGYPCQSYEVETADNVSLTIFRIPHGRHGWGGRNESRGVVFLQHGLLSTSVDWVINFPEQSLAFLLADAGFDVWLGNVRGNTYGRASVNMKKDFWGFSFDEMAHYDLPAMIEKALEVSGAERVAAYIGHSQGATMALIGFPERRVWAASKVAAFYALAPIAHMGSTTSPLRFLAAASENPVVVGILRWTLGGQELLPRSAIIRNLCKAAPKAICGNFLALIAGWDWAGQNATRLPLYACKTPAGTSARNLIHFGQLIRNDRLQAYDFFPAENRRRYGQPQPPLYKVEDFPVPTSLFWGSADILADPSDVRRLRDEMGDAVVLANEIEGMAHLGFTWGMNAPQSVYAPIIRRLQHSTS